ncbi:nucleotidyltransferase family protein [Flavimaricola marinus]|uniref:Molybdopterin-guanine dinucleotide biosynthesis protein A n=1 Tax=Flavimaricola marinus TaxID=1819565 RepID=A0A238LEW9_9RHOB|nr:nucleotidyltransferase family protein [Flavimaricola marinus]SMY07460.1 molybdopterin-guanine dinucleotide biosynthesis protein A [Flavimaricola marinus]
MIPILILAAGESSRMRGRDKLLEIIDGEPLLRRQVRAAGAAGLDVWVALPAPDQPRVEVLDGVAHHPLFLPGSSEGMGGTLRDGVAALPPCSRFMVLAADLPGLTTEDFATMAEAVPQAGGIIVATAASGNLGHPVVFDARLRPDFAMLSGDEGAKRVVRAHKSKMRTLALPGDHATRDLDTPEEWAEWRAEQD